jgi:hypothetical protein
MTPNQGCDKENMPRFEGGDVRLSIQPDPADDGRPEASARVQPAPGDPIPEPTP